MYAARDRLLKEGLLVADQKYSYDAYHLTDAGLNRVAELEQRLGDDAGWIKGVGGYVTSKSFSRLLDETYARWPEFATRSVVRRNV